MLYTIFKFTPNVNATNYNSIGLMSLSWTFQKVNKFNKYMDIYSLFQIWTIETKQ